jgi:hypothetical protein
MSKQWDFNGEKITATFTGNRGHAMIWCSHWEYVDDMANAGLLRKECAGPSTYNHMTYYLPFYEEE